MTFLVRVRVAQAGRRLPADRLALWLRAGRRRHGVRVLASAPTAETTEGAVEYVLRVAGRQAGLERWQASAVGYGIRVVECQRCAGAVDAPPAGVTRLV